MLYACTVLTLTLYLGPRDMIYVLNASYRDLNGTGQLGTTLFASYSDSAPWGWRAHCAQHTFPPMGARIDGCAHVAENIHHLDTSSWNCCQVVALFYNCATVTYFFATFVSIVLHGFSSRDSANGLCTSSAVFLREMRIQLFQMGFHVKTNSMWNF